jgi:rhodanese-related sulfurtransferase
MMTKNKSYILLDVRTEEEFKERHIKGAVLIPDFQIKQRAETELTDKNALILIYCRSGRRSANSARRLIEMGYTNVYDFGGIIDWPYDTVRDKSL